MAFLNPLGANVRNHMSTIEDKYVEQARQAFPVAPKQSRIPQFHSNQVATAAKAVSEAVKTMPRNELPAAKIPGKTIGVEQSGPKKNGSFGKPASTANANAAKPVAVPNRVPGHPETSVPRVNQPLGQIAGQPGNQATRTASAIKSQPAQQRTNTLPREHSTQGRPATHIEHRDNRPNRIPEPAAKHPVGAQSLQRHDGPRSKTGPNQERFVSETRRENTDERGQRSKIRPNANVNVRGQAKPESVSQHPAKQVKPVKPQRQTTSVKSIQLPDSMSVKDFAQLVELPVTDIIKKLIGLGVMVTINQEIDRDTMILIADEYGITATAAQTEEEKLQVEEIEDDPSTLVPRPPVVTILGHVDHGKTSLLDAIRQTNVTAQEAGGITQHIGAYQVELKDRKITFLDTPGHAAFTAMRARGAQVTDIAVLVVAADDGVMPQTVEAINHAKDANVPIIVALNKIDKAEANLERIKTDLTEYGLVSEEWGGETIFVPVSAKKRIGIENLLEMILLVADIKDFKANPNRLAKGTIIEAKLDKGRGPVATVLVQTGTLKVGDPIIAGAAAGKVRVLNNDKGKRVKKAGPSTPVEVIGFDEVPEAGDIMYVTTEDKIARDLADRRLQYKRETEMKKNQKITLDDLFDKIKEGEIKELKVIIKADVQGSVEAIRSSLEQQSTGEVRVKVIHGGVGAIGEGDVMLASASNAIIIGFNVRPDPMAKRISEKENVDIRLYRVIYNIIEDVQKAMEGMLEPTYKEVVNGKAEIRQVYRVAKVGNIAGCYVLEGKISRNNDIRLLRDNIVVHEGKIESLKRFKDDAREVSEGFECGIGIEKFGDIKEGDIIEAFSMEEVKRTVVK